jgi:hypothetical protein
VWPPKGGFVPAWRRVTKHHLDVIPSVCAPTGAVYLVEPTMTVPNDGWETVCPICGGKNGCRANHDECLRWELERTLKRTRSPARRAQLAAALAPLPPLPPQPKVSRRSRAIQRWRPPTITTSRMP